MIRADADCGCCTGIEVAVPMSEVNPRGLSAIAYRVGTYGTFYETMLARLSSLVFELQSDNGTDLLRPLAKLTTRDPSDPSIALLDAWAIVGDVLTFYQERIANEGYLPTAIERRSLLELGRLVGYRLRPGLSASVKLAFTTATGFSGDIPAGTRAQSMPNAGENPQFFETSAVLTARDTWNALRPLRVRPQLVTPPDDGGNMPAPSDARVVVTMYFDGVATNLKPSDRLFFTFGSDSTQQVLRVVQDVIPQPPDARTFVTLVPYESLSFTAAPIELWRAEAQVLFPGSNIADAVFAVLDQLKSNAMQAHADLGALVAGAIPPIEQQRDIAAARGFSRLTAWLGALLQAMQSGGSFVASDDGGGGKGTQILPIRTPLLAASPLANLAAAVADLAQPRSVQPANPLRLARSVTTSFAPRSDLAPRLLSTFQPAASSGLYAAWSKVETPPARLQVFAPRIKATLFASSFAGSTTFHHANGTTSFTPPSLTNVYTTGITHDLLPLDSVYDQIKPGGWIVVEVPGVQTTFHKVVATHTRNMDTGIGFAAKVTALTIEPSWFDTVSSASNSTGILRSTVVYAQAEALNRVDEPVDADAGGDTIDIDGVLDGLEAGRWIIVSGNRTNVAAVAAATASEAAMIAGVSQGTSAPLSTPFPPGRPPFDTIFYMTDANAAGDRLVVGRLRPHLVTQTPGEFPTTATLPGWDLPQFTGQQYRDQVLLGPDANGQNVYATAYVPSRGERLGQNGSFNGMLVDPANGLPFIRGVIPETQLLAGVFAWRIATPKLNTSLTLANALAYRYDRNTVTIYGNVVDATQGQTTGEVLGDGDATVAFDSFALRQAPLTYLPAPTPSGITSTLQVRVNELAWHEAPDLFSTVAGQRSFIVREDDSGKTRVTFGDGTHGARPPTGSANIKATYRYGMGKSGNVLAGQISQLATQPLGLKAVINPLPATGGADSDRPDQARGNTPVATLALDRLVSVRDYGDFARNFAGIGKASARMLSDGIQQVVHVTVAGVDDIPIDLNDALAVNLRAAFAVNGDPFRSVELGVRRLRLIVIAATVSINADYLWEDVAPAIRNALLGEFGFMSRTLGQPAFASEAIAVMQSVPGVLYVNLTVFDSVGEDASAGDLAHLAQRLKPRPFVAAELARIDPGDDPGGAARILPAELAIVTPDITDMIILTQATS